ncbi:uncharacterized protein LOC109838113 [Asparagus officinalis]|uniref:uncharacterized protein LOC109838113 n=1 Tax=Asparagus officinalis TaxID=4686 RepID=UPI00098E7A3D|nr:uncharacterized protein LOC109838113 [Asparagus officinalis]
MKFGSWNVRGLNNPAKRRLVKDCLKFAKVDLVGLQETKLNSSRVSFLRSLGSSSISSWISLDASESRGGVLLGWNDNIFSCSSSSVDIFSVAAILTHSPSNWTFAVTSVYAPCDPSDREVCWWELNRTRSSHPHPWVVFGDFNMTLSLSERSGRSGSIKDIDTFKNLVASLHLSDLPLSGRKFTWSNYRSSPVLPRFMGFFLFSWVFSSYPSFQDQTYQEKDEVVEKNCLRSQFHLYASLSEQIDALNLCEESRALSLMEIQSRSSMKDQLLALAHAEEVKWRQRSRIKWLKEGDNNTKFFHNYASHRRRKNFIPYLISNGSIISEDVEIKRSFFEYFSNIFQQPPQSRLSLNWSVLYPGINPVLSSLDLPFSSKEIKTAVFSLHPDKSPGPDETDVTVFFKKLFSNPHSLQDINFSYICLIPKKDGATSPSDFRPISLLNSSCKIFSKILANRLCGVLHLLIDQSQSAFQKGKSSLDSILLAQEMINFCSSARGFSNRWCSWIHHILSSSKSAVLVNGSPTKFFHCHRGLKQGDPLSPLLFLLVADVLKKMISYSASAGDLSDLKLKGELNNIRMLQFADDTIVFSRASSEDMNTLKAILLIFANISGLRVNSNKSYLYYLGRFPGRKHLLARALSCSVGSLPFSYLGLPLKKGSLSRREWQPLLDSFSKKLSLWKNKNLSIGGRLTLVNSVLSSIPLYYTSFFKLPKWLIHEIDKLRRNFLWNGNTNASKAKCLVAWKTVCLPKKEGGLGVIDLTVFNQALLSKWIWKIFDRDSIISKVIFSLYSKEDSNPVVRHPKIQASKLLKYLFSIHPAFFSFVRWKVGNGRSCRFWLDKWSSPNSLGSLFPKAFNLAFSKDCNLRSQGYMLNHVWHWHFTLRRGISPEERQEIQKLYSHLESFSGSFTLSPDSLWWPLQSSGIFTVKSFYSALISGGSKSRVGLGDPRCPFCGLVVEEQDHLFISCSFASSIWLTLFPGFNVALWPTSMDSLITPTAPPLNDRDIGIIWNTVLPCCCWCIWNCRNQLIFKDIMSNPENIAANVARYTLLWAGSKDDRLTRRIRRAALKLQIQEIAKKKAGADMDENFLVD